MKKYLLSLSLLCLLSGCRTLTHDPQLMTQSHSDSVSTHSILYDSIYIDNWQIIEHRPDTLYIDRTRIEYRYKLLRDTLIQVHRDTIPIVKKVHITHREPYLPRWAKLLSFIGLLSIIYFALTLFMRK